MPRRRLAFAAHAGQPAPRSTLPGVACFPSPGAAAVMTGPAVPGPGPAGRCRMTPAVPSAALATIQPARPPACYLEVSYRDRALPVPGGPDG